MAWARLRFTTARTYAVVTIHLIAPVLGHLRVSVLSSAHLEQAQVAWQRAGVKPSMRRKAIEVLRSALNPGDAVLTTRNRRPYWSSYLYADMKRRLERLKMQHMRFHDLRHTAASLMLAEGVPPRTVMEMMGHRNLAVTMLVYGHTNLRHQREAVGRLDAAFRRRFA